MAGKTLTITMPDSPEERQEVLAYLEGRGLIPTKRSVDKKTGKGRWAKVAEEMASHAYMEGACGEKMSESIQEFRETFKVSSPLEKGSE